MYALLDFILLFQPSASAMGGGGGGGGGAGPAGCAGGGASSQLFMLVAMLAAMWFLIYRPQQKQQQTHDAMLKKLKVGDVVRTDSGIRGEITKLGDRDVDLLVAERTKINVLRGRIAGLEGTPAAQAAQSNQPKE